MLSYRRDARGGKGVLDRGGDGGGQKIGHNLREINRCNNTFHIPQHTKTHIAHTYHTLGRHKGKVR